MKHKGCYNHPPYVETVVIRAAKGDVPEVSYPNRLARYCQFTLTTLGQEDPRCNNCLWRDTEHLGPTVHDYTRHGEAHPVIEYCPQSKRYEAHGRGLGPKEGDELIIKSRSGLVLRVRAGFVVRHTHPERWAANITEVPRA